MLVLCVFYSKCVLFPLMISSTTKLFICNFMTIWFNKAIPLCQALQTMQL